MKNVFLPIVIALAVFPQLLWGAAPIESRHSLDREDPYPIVSIEETADTGPWAVSYPSLAPLQSIDSEWEIQLKELDHASCMGAEDGVAEISISGDISQYTIEWNTLPPQYGPRAHGLDPGTYEVSVIDEIGNVKQKSITITAERSIEAYVRVDSDATHPQSLDGAATVVLVRPGIGNHTFEWHTPTTQTTATATGLAKGMHLVTITDSEGCQITESVTIINQSPHGRSLSEESPHANPLVTPTSLRSTYSNQIESPPLPSDLLNVYPNPSEGIVYLETKFSGTIQVQIRDLRGRAVFSTQAASAHYNEFNLGDVPRGIYILQVAHPVSGERVSKRLTIR